MPLSSDGGWDLPTLRNTLRQSAPRLAYLIPDFHNPTGVLIPAQQRRELAAAARASSTIIVVDESSVALDLRPANIDLERAAVAAEPPMASFGPDIVSIGSLSKPFWGGLRIGWIRASPHLVHELAIVRAGIDMSGSVIDQLIAIELLKRQDEVLQFRVRQLVAGRATLLALLAQHLPQWKSAVPVGGLWCWVELDEPMATPLGLRAEELGVLLTPGSRFVVEPTMERFLRLPFCLPTQDLSEAIRRVAQAWQSLEPGRRVRRERSILLT